MLIPLVCPELLVIPFPIRPISLHVAQELRLSEVSQNGTDVGVSAAVVAVGVVASVTVIGPAGHVRYAVFTSTGHHSERKREVGTHQSPCTVQLSTGPVTGSVSQNCVNSICPPGALKQHRSFCTVVFWQLSCGLEQDFGSRGNRSEV